MKIKIDDETITKATQCSQEFACLKGGEDKLCPAVGRVIGAPNSVIFIHFNKQESCKYRSRFGKSDVCRCPVRVEIFNRYEK